MSDVEHRIDWLRTEDSPRLPAPANMTGIVGWARANLFSSIWNTILTILGVAFIAWFAWGILDWAIFRGTFFGENREACVVGQAEGKELGACWPYVYAKFHQFVYGFYPFDQRWRVNICFIVGAGALIPMMIPKAPYKKWNAIFLIVVYPLMTFILLTGGRLSVSQDTLWGLWALFCLSATLIPLLGFGIEDGLKRNRLGLALAGLAVLVWVGSIFVPTPTLIPETLSISAAGAIVIVFLMVAAALSLRPLLGVRDPAARQAFINWAVIWGGIAVALMLVTFDFGLVPVETQQWGGLLVTLVVAVTGIVASLPLGILLALGRRSKMPMLKLFSIVFIEVWRGVPLITVLFMASIMLPLFLPEGMTFDKLLRALVGTALFSAAYMAETVRGGLQAIPRGQYEAAHALGLPYWKTMNLIVLPQALKIVIPGIVNSFISLFKDTTLVAIIGLFDLLGIVHAGFADPKWASPQTAPTGYFVAGMIFWIFCFGMSRYSIFMERRLATGHKR
jgi:general L-amino acid transport system permease protein